jgi:hypothetical protein
MGSRKPWSHTCKCTLQMIGRGVVGSYSAVQMQVLRRYLLFSRALVAVPLAAVQGLKPHQLDDQAVAVFAAKALSEQPWHRCG